MNTRDVELYLDDLERNLGELNECTDEYVSRELAQRVVYNQVETFREIVKLLESI